MNAKSLMPFMLTSTTVVIDVNGEIRELVPGEVPAPGEVIVVLGQGATAAIDPQLEAQLVGDDGANLSLNLDNEIASIIEQIEQGVDPTQNEDFATAAGGQNGSSLTTSGDIERTGAETLAATQFDTEGLESQGLSETQSLALLELVTQAVLVGDDSVTVFETDEPLIVTGTVEATETDVPTFIPQDEVVGDNGVFSIDADGNWTYEANSAFDELNIGDSLVDVFQVESTDGTLGSVTVTINGTNDLPQFVAAQDFVPPGAEEPTPQAFEDGVYTFDIPENTEPGIPIGQVAATDPDNEILIFSIFTNIQNEGGEDLFQIDPDTGVISLTEAGAESYVNDYELLENVHQIVVTVTEGDGIGEPQSVNVDVIFNETDVNEPPIFDPPGDGGDDYVFNYPENSDAGAVVGSVNATDPEQTFITYSLDFSNDPELDGLFSIDPDGTIRLTADGAATFTNDYEWGDDNAHSISVVATDETGLSTSINVVINETDVNEVPVSEDFDVDAGDATFVPIIFDSDDEDMDHIFDEDDDFNGIELNVMITSLPQHGTLLYTDDFGETRVVTEDNLHNLGDEIDPSNLFDPDNFTYVPGPGDPFEIGYSGDPEDIVLDDDGFYNWGEWVSDTERLITLDNGNTIGISITDNNGKPLMQYTGGKPHVGWGIGDIDGNGMNKKETLIVDLSDNPLGEVTFGLDGMGGSFIANSKVYVEVTYTFADGTTHVEQYQKDEGDTGNQQILYDFSYSSPDNPIVLMELSSTGGNWELRYLSGVQDITEEVTFDYVAVDSELLVSNESTVTIDATDSPEYEVLSADEGDELNADLGNQVMLGDENDNVFTWLDSTLDNGTDVVDNFDLGSDLLDLRDILAEDDNVTVGDLIDSISAEVDGDDVVLTVSNEGREQTIILEGMTNAFEEAGLVENNSITDELEMLTQVLKTDVA